MGYVSKEYKPNNKKKVIASRINKAAKIYKDNFIGRTFLFLYEGNAIEAKFRADNFLHLCGVDTHLYAKYFYNKASNQQLKPKEIGFSNIHPYRFADIKTKHLEDMLSLIKRDSLIITEVNTSTKTYKLGTTDCELVICFDEQLNDNGEPINDILIPYSLRIEEVANNRFNEIFEVDYVLSKDTNSKTYDTIEFGNRKLLQFYLFNNNITEYSIKITPNSEGNPSTNIKKDDVKPSKTEKDTISKDAVISSKSFKKYKTKTQKKDNALKITQNALQDFCAALQERGIDAEAINSTYKEISSQYLNEVDSNYNIEL